MIKIIPTVGPVTCDIKNLEILSTYSNVFRLNTSHNDISWHKKVVKKINLLKKDIKVLVDIPGVKPRTKNHIDVSINKNSIVVFYFNKRPRLKYFKAIYILLSNPIPKTNIYKNKKKLSVDDGKFLFEIIKISKKYIVANSLQSFVLKPNKGFNLPNSVYDNSLQARKYLTFLRKLDKVKFDAIGLSFIQNHNLIVKIKNKYPKKLIIAKIENLEGVKNMHSICLNSDAVMIDRGDLAAEIGNDNLFKTIVKISQVCKSLNKPLVMATENLESMINNQMPTKSEIFTLGYYDQINVDTVMLSDETATSKNWKNIVQWIYRFFNNKKLSKKNIFQEEEIFWNLLRADLKLPLVIFTKMGKSINNVEKLSYFNEVNVFTENKKVKIFCEFKKNINVYLTKKFENNDFLKFIKQNIKKNIKSIFKNSNQVIVIYISYPRKNSRANTMILLNKKDIS